MKVFGYDFTNLGDSHVDELMSLEREKAVYSDYWIDELEDFRHVRIVLTDDEITEYVRSMIAFDRFLGSDATWARDVSAIPRDIANRADSYVGRTCDETFGPPWHCAAGFVGEHWKRFSALTGLVFRCLRNREQRPS